MVTTAASECGEDRFAWTARYDPSHATAGPDSPPRTPPKPSRMSRTTHGRTEARWVQPQGHQPPRSGDCSVTGRRPGPATRRVGHDPPLTTRTVPAGHPSRRGPASCRSDSRTRSRDSANRASPTWSVCRSTTTQAPANRRHPCRPPPGDPTRQGRRCGELRPAAAGVQHRRDRREWSDGGADDRRRLGRGRARVPGGARSGTR